MTRRVHGLSDIAPPVPTGSEVVHVVGAAVLRDGLCMIARRKPGGTEGRKWEFPGGKVEGDETPQVALEREILEEFGESIHVAEWLGRGLDPQGTRLIVLDVYRASLDTPSRTLRSTAHDDVRWAPRHALSGFDWAKADVPVVPRVAELLERLQSE